MMQKTADRTALKAACSVFSPNCGEFAISGGGGGLYANFSIGVVPLGPCGSAA